MRLLIVAAPCVGCCRGSRHYSTSAWHQCLFQFHLIALVIKLGTDTTHHIIALITSELHCVHMTISLTQTPIPAASLFALSVPLSLYFPSQIWPPPHCVSSITHGCPVSVQLTNDIRFTMIHSVIISTTSYAKLFILRAGCWGSWWGGN